ncbi:MAG TPA: 4Fe-4S binding protein [Caldilineae bacterium]|nr:4Fe-4S binding protein [Caldilineae bacterium]
MTEKRRITPIAPSTRAFIEEARHAPNYSWKDFIHGYVYARWPYLYIGTGVGESRLAHILGPILAWLSRFRPSPPEDAPNRPTFANGYHGKVVTLDAAKQLVSVDQDISLTNLEHVIPFEKARDIIFTDPDHIAVLDCPCRASRPDPCLPLDVCLIVGEPFAGFILEHNPERARAITSDEAISILSAEHERGHVHHAYFKDAMLGRFYAICNCCACCCGAMQATRNGIPMIIPSGYVALVEPDNCIGCETCARYCQFGALSLDDDFVISVDESACMGCGVCVDKCKNEALSLVLDPNRVAPLELQQLM